jgi:hypothetical protein
MTAVGYFKKQSAFVARHKLFFERFPRLMAAINSAFDRTITASGSLDPVIFYLGSRTVDDFEAILVLAANDIALPAQALVRGMYERVVTAAHLHENPSEVVDFTEFDYVQRRRAASAIRDTIGIPPERDSSMEDLEREYQRVKARFEISCDECGKKRVGPNWSKLDFVTIAKRQEPLSKLIVPAYYLPLQQVHSTLRSATACLDVEGGQPMLRKQYMDVSDETFRLAYVLVLHALRVQLEHFQWPELDEAIDIALNDHLENYGAGDSDEDATGA